MMPANFMKNSAAVGTGLEERGTLHEYYIPETGEPVINSGFINWNMLVLNMEDELSGRKSMDDYIHVLLPY